MRPLQRRQGRTPRARRPRPPAPAGRWPTVYFGRHGRRRRVHGALHRSLRTRPDGWAARCPASVSHACRLPLLRGIPAITDRMKQAGAEVLTSAVELPAEDLVARIYEAMALEVQVVGPGDRPLNECHPASGAAV